jgi:hypothetical protein
MGEEGLGFICEKWVTIEDMHVSRMTLIGYDEGSGYESVTFNGRMVVK